MLFACCLTIEVSCPDTHGFKSSSTITSDIRRVLTCGAHIHPQCIPLQGTQVLHFTSCGVIITNTEAIESMQGGVCVRACPPAHAHARTHAFFFFFAAEFHFHIIKSMHECTDMHYKSKRGRQAERYG